MAGVTHSTVVSPYEDETKVPLGSMCIASPQYRSDKVSQPFGNVSGSNVGQSWRYLSYVNNNGQWQDYEAFPRNMKAAYARLGLLLLLALALMALALATLHTYHGEVSVSSQALGNSVTLAQLQKLEAEVDGVADRLALGALSLGRTLQAAGVVDDVLLDVTSERARSLAWYALSSVSGLHRVTYGTGTGGIVGYRRADWDERPTSRMLAVTGSPPFASSYVDLLMSMPADPASPQGPWRSQMFAVNKDTGEPLLSTLLSAKTTPSALAWPWFRQAQSSPLPNVTWSLWAGWAPCSNLSESIPGVETLSNPMDGSGMRMQQLPVAFLLASTSVTSASGKGGTVAGIISNSTNGASIGLAGRNSSGNSTSNASFNSMDDGGDDDVVVVSVGEKVAELAGFLQDSAVEDGRMFLLLADTGELVVASHSSWSPLMADHQLDATSALNSSDPVIAAAARHLADQFGSPGAGAGANASANGLCWDMYRAQVYAHGRAWSLLCRGRVYGRSAQLPLVAVILTPVTALEASVVEDRSGPPRMLILWTIILAAVTILAALVVGIPSESALARKLPSWFFPTPVPRHQRLSAGKMDPMTDGSVKSPKDKSGAWAGGSVHGGSVYGGSVHGGSVHGGSVHGGSVHGGGGKSGGYAVVVPLGSKLSIDSSRHDRSIGEHWERSSIDMRTPLEKLHNILGELSQGVRQPGPEVLSEMAMLLEMPDPHMPAIFQENDVAGNNMGYRLGLSQQLHEGKLTKPFSMTKRPKTVYEEVDEDTQRWLRSSVMRIQGTVKDRRSRTSLSAETPFFSAEMVPGTPMDAGNDSTESLPEWTVATVAEALRSPAQLDNMQLKLDPNTGLPIMIPVNPATPQRRSSSVGSPANNPNVGAISAHAEELGMRMRRMQRVSDVLGSSDEARRCLALVGQWDYDTWKLEKASNGMPTLFMGLTLYQQAGLLRQFHLPQNKLIRFLSVIDGNMCNNDYHNSTHVADVANSVYHLIKHSGVGRFLSRIDVLAAITAALVHDYKHPGRNNDFLVRSEGELALLYNDRTVLENMHVAEAFKLLRRPDLNFLEGMDSEDFRLLRATIIEMVLGSDLKRHFEILDLFKKRTQDKAKPLEADSISPTDRVLLLQVALKVADIGHSAKSLDIHKKWTDAITEEFFKQGDEERRLELPVSSFMDRYNTNVPKSQTSFFKFIALPLFEAWAAAFPASQSILDQMKSNISYWEKQKHTPGEPFRQ